MINVESMNKWWEASGNSKIMKKNTYLHITGIPGFQVPTAGGPRRGIRALGSLHFAPAGGPQKKDGPRQSRLCPSAVYTLPPKF